MHSTDPQFNLPNNRALNTSYKIYYTKYYMYFAYKGLAELTIMISCGTYHFKHTNVTWSSVSQTNFNDLTLKGKTNFNDLTIRVNV